MYFQNLPSAFSTPLTNFNPSLIVTENGMLSMTQNDPEDPMTSNGYINGEEIQKCLVCGYKCPHKNYNVYCCNACAAFFRRTIKQDRTYVCAKGKKCRVDFGGHKRTCRFCRFQRCLSVGMSIGYVLARSNDLDTKPDLNIPVKSPTVVGNSLAPNCTLKRLVEAFGSTFVNRLQAKSQEYVYDGKTIDRSMKGLVATMHTCFCEFDVMMRYLKQTGIQTMLDGESEFITLGSRVFYIWFFIHGCWSTLRNSGHHQNSIYFADESSLELTPTNEQQYVTSLQALRDPRAVAKSLFELHNSGMSTSLKFRAADIDVNDFALICQIVALQSAIQLYPWKTGLRQQLNVVFKSACLHYEQNYREVPVKFGNLILLINEAQQFIKEFEEWVIFLSLNGGKPALDQILCSWSIASSAFSMSL